MNERAAIYARFSCDKQRDASIDDQLYECNRYAQGKGYEVVAQYCDYAMSGRSDDRPQFLSMIEEAKAGQFATILVWKLDRFARSMEDHFYYEHVLGEAGVRLESVMEHVSGGTIEATTNKAVTALFAQIRSQQSAVDTMRGMLGKARRCEYLGYQLFGYDHDEDKIIVDEREAAAVRHIFEEYARGTSVGELSRWLTESGLKTFKNARAGYNFINRLLKNEAYLGVYQWGVEKDERGEAVLDEFGAPRPLVRVEGGMPAIIDHDLWDAAHARLRTRPRLNIAEAYELTGKLTCSKCGNPLHGARANGNGGAYRYYHCKGKTRTCFGTLTKDRLESAVANAIRDLIDDSEGRAKLTEIMTKYRTKSANLDEAKALKRQARAAGRKAKRLIDAVADGAPWKSVERDYELYVARQKALEEQAVEKERAKVAIDPNELDGFFDALCTDLASDKELLRAFVRRCWLIEGGVVVTLNMGTRDATFAEIEAALDNESSENSEVDGMVRLEHKWCPTCDTKRTLVVLKGGAQAFAIPTGIGLLIAV